MRRVTLLAALLAVASVFVIGVARIGAGAQDDEPTNANRGFVGSWRITSETPFGSSQSLMTVMADGTVLFTDRPALPGGAGFPVSFISTGHGSWEQTGPTAATATWVEFVTDGEGNFLATVTGTVEATLEADGNSWSGPFSSTSADPAGTVLFVGGGSVQATRITVQPLATPSAGTPAT